MIWGLSTETFTLVHVMLSFVGIGAGFIAMGGWLAGQRLEGATALFLVTTVATNVTGFGFPFDKLLPSHIVGIISLGLLAVAILARYPMGLAGIWRPGFVVTAALSLYLNAFVGVVQAFQKIPGLKALAPKGEEPPFAATQGVVLLLFVALIALSVKRFPREPAA